MFPKVFMRSSFLNLLFMTAHSLIRAAPSPIGDLTLQPSLLTGIFNTTTLRSQTPDKTKLYRIPYTPISILYEPHPSKHFNLSLISQMLDDALTRVEHRIEIQGNVVLPAHWDPYIYDDLAAPSPLGGWVMLHSPDRGPGFGRRLTWGNVRDALVGLREVMVNGEKGLPCKVDVWVRYEGLGIIGWGEVTPGEVPANLGGR